MSQLQCILVTPEQTVCDAEADLVTMTLFDGQIGIAPGHTPLIGRLGYGELRIVFGSKATRYYVDGGFVEVMDDVVSVLTPHAIPVEELDEAAAQGQLLEVRAHPAKTPEEMAARDNLVAQCRAKLHIARQQ
jgi:F-type H+-transporting ATPase subunit epsilon